MNYDVQIKNLCSMAKHLREMSELARQRGNINLADTLENEARIKDDQTKAMEKAALLDTRVKRKGE
jgi:hypothetical protein